MVVVREILFTCAICAANVYHQSELDIPNFCVTWVLMSFGKGHNHMVSSAWSYSNAYFPFLRHIIHPFFGTSMWNLYLSMDYLSIKWTTIQIFLYLCMDVLRKNPCMHIHIYIILGQDAILFEWSFIFASYTIRVLIFTG